MVSPMLKAGVGKNVALPLLFLLQFFCVLYLIGDAIADFKGGDEVESSERSHALEYTVVTALVFSLVFTGLEIRKILRRSSRVEDQLKAASGAFAEVLDEHFTTWKLTRSERDVAMLAIKGLGIAEIAEIRATKDGTIKAQLNAIYKKADVSGRPQFISLFVEELMGEALGSGSNL